MFFSSVPKNVSNRKSWKKIVQNFQKTISGPNFQRKEKTQICFLFCYHPYHFTLSETVEYVIVGFFRLVKIVSKFPIQNALSFYCVMFTKYLSWNKKSLWWVAHVKSANSSLNALHSAESLHKNEEARIWFFTHMLLECNEGFLASSTTLCNNQQHDNDCCT